MYLFFVLCLNALRLFALSLMLSVLMLLWLMASGMMASSFFPAINQTFMGQDFFFCFKEIPY